MYATAYKAHFKYQTHERLQKTKSPVTLATCEWDPNNKHTKSLAKHTSNTKLKLLNEDFSKWGLSLLSFFD